MLDRDDLSFATLHQLAGEIENDWETDRPQLVDQALLVLHRLDEPELNCDSKMMQIAMLSMAISTCKTIIAKSDAWKSNAADMVKKELLSRIKEYEKRRTKISEPVLDSRNFELQA